MTDVTASTPLSSEALASMGRRHGRPDLVMPLHVVAGFRESERGIRDSGVRPVKAMVESRRQKRVLQRTGIVSQESIRS
jgi:hypothetical protein